MPVVSHQVVVAHHWRAGIDALERSWIASGASIDTVNAHTGECSVPFSLTVTETEQDGRHEYAVEPLAPACPVCGRFFTGEERLALCHAAIAAHLRLPAYELAYEPDSGAHVVRRTPVDVIFDI